MLLDVAKKVASGEIHRRQAVDAIIKASNEHSD